jgi:MFS transporter, Spinster family, sphingosine-1-phosphate transporter
VDAAAGAVRFHRSLEPQLRYGAKGLKIQLFTPRGSLILGLLVFVNILNFLDRLLPSILVEAIRRDLKLSDTQIGLMGGVAFAVVYSFGSIWLARVADRRSPRTVISISLAFWSVATAFSGLAQNFVHLLLARSSVAAGEAGSTPSGHSLIARIFPDSSRSMAMAIFSLGVPIGATLGLSLGGWINDVLNWRAAFFVAGIPGLIVAALIRFVIPDPPRASQGSPSAGGFFNAMRLLFAKRSFRHMAIASSLFAIGSYAMNIFAAAFLIRIHHVTAAQAGLLFGLAFGLGGLVGTFSGGALGDWLGRRDVRWRQGVPAVGLALSAPTALVAFLAPNLAISVAGLIGVYLFGLMYLAPTFAAAQSLVPDEMRATVSGVLLFCLTLVGATVGPLLVGVLSDTFAPRYGASALRYALSLMPITMVWSALHFALAARALPADLAPQDR